MRRGVWGLDIQAYSQLHSEEEINPDYRRAYQGHTFFKVGFCQARKVHVCVKDPDVVANGFNLRIWEAKEGYEFKTSLGY